MKKNRLMIAAAVAALTAGSGPALAQDSSKPQGGASAPSAQHPSAQQPSAQQPKAQAPSGGMKSTTGAGESKGAETKGAAEQHKGSSAQKVDDKASTNKMGQEKAQDSKSKSTSGQAPTQSEKKEQRGTTGQSGQMEKNRSGQTTGQAPSQGQTQQQRSTTGQGMQPGQGTTQQRQGTEQRGTNGQVGGQAGTSSSTSTSTSTSANLSTEQRTRIHEVIVKDRSAPRVSNVDFSINVGTVVPRGKVKFAPLPREIVEIQPAWRGYEFFLVRDEIIVVDPGTLRIVAVIPA